MHPRGHLQHLVSVQVSVHFGITVKAHQDAECAQWGAFCVWFAFRSMPIGITMKAHQDAECAQ
jgi:hypothetical protein